MSFDLRHPQYVIVTSRQRLCFVRYEFDVFLVHGAMSKF